MPLLQRLGAPVRRLQGDQVDLLVHELKVTSDIILFDPFALMQTCDLRGIAVEWYVNPLCSLISKPTHCHPLTSWSSFWRPTITSHWKAWNLLLLSLRWWGRLDCYDSQCLRGLCFVPETSEGAGDTTSGKTHDP